MLFHLNNKVEKCCGWNELLWGEHEGEHLESMAANLV